MVLTVHVLMLIVLVDRRGAGLVVPIDLQISQQGVICPSDKDPFSSRAGVSWSVVGGSVVSRGFTGWETTGESSPGQNALENCSRSFRMNEGRNHYCHLLGNSEMHGPLLECRSSEVWRVLCTCW